MGVGGYGTPLTIGYLGIGCCHVTASVTRYLGSGVSPFSGFNCLNIMSLEWRGNVFVTRTVVV
jgi:hypothetical protein